jgi:hypothetical protein
MSSQPAAAAVSVSQALLAENGGTVPDTRPVAVERGATKTIHFVRHAQATHNAAAEMDGRAAYASPVREASTTTKTGEISLCRNFYPHSINWAYQGAKRRQYSVTGGSAHAHTLHAWVAVSTRGAGGMCHHYARCGGIVGTCCTYHARHCRLCGCAHTAMLVSCKYVT